MKVLKWIGGIILALLIIAIVLIIVLPNENHVEATHEIQASKYMVYNAVVDLRAHEIWNPWRKMDPSMEMMLGEKTKGKGATYSWTSDNMGNGNYTIIEAKAYETITTDVQFGKRGGGKGTYTFSELDGVTTVTWGFDFESKGYRKLIMPFMKGTMKKTFKEGLQELDQLVQQRKEGKYYSFQVEEFLMDRKEYIMSRQRVDINRVQQFYASNLGNLFSSLQEADVQMTGRPSGLIYNWEKDKVDLAAALPISDHVEIEGAVSEAILPGPAVQVEYYGDYDGLDRVHLAIQSYLNDRNLVHDWPVIVEYVTDPSEEENSDKWLTKVIYKLGEK